jgi:hypothetical protein
VHRVERVKAEVVDWKREGEVGVAEHSNGERERENDAILEEENEEHSTYC